MEGGFEDELVMLSIPCLILDFRCNFLLIRKRKKKKKAKAGEFLPLRLLNCGFAGGGGDYGIWVRYSIMLWSHVSQVLAEKKKHTLSYYAHFAFYFYLLAKIMSRGGRSDGMVGSTFWQPQYARVRQLATDG